MGSFTDFKPLSFFQNRLIKRKKFAVQKLGENFLVLIKISHLVFISKAFFPQKTFETKDMKASKEKLFKSSFIIFLMKFYFIQ